MKNRNSIRTDSGFTLIELSVVVLAMAIIMAISVPAINNAVRRYRLNAAARQVADMIQRARMQAISESRRSSLVIDTTGLRVGLISYNDDGTVRSEQYIPMPEGVRVDAPAGNTAPTAGAPTAAVSFPAKAGAAGSFQLDFNSRGFPVVAVAGDINSVYLTNDLSSRAITLNSVGAVQSWEWDHSTWINSKGITSTTSTGNSNTGGSPGKGGK